MGREGSNPSKSIGWIIHMRLVLALVLSLVLSGCGYTTGSLLPSNYHTIAIEKFGNKIAFLNEDRRTSYIPLLEIRAHDAIVNRFQQDGHLKIAKSGNTADMIIKGELLSFER